MTRLTALLLAIAASGCSASATPTLGGVELTIQTAPAYSPEPGAVEAFPAALLLPVRIGRVGNRLTFIGASSGQEVAVTWPHGFTARLIDGKGTLLDPSGAVIGREGDTLSDLGGGIGDDPAAGFGVCAIGSHIYG